MRTERTTSWSTLAALAVIPLALGACSEKIESDPQATGIEAASLSLGARTPASSAASGYNTYLYSELDVDVYSRPGAGDFFEQGVIVKAIHAEVGDRVSRGQLLVTLEDDEAAFEVAAARARADEAKANHERIKGLRESDLASPSEYDAALYAMRRTAATLERAQLDLSRTRVRAPFDGVVSRRYVRLGELVVGGTPLFRITAMTPLRARLLIPESEAAVFRNGSSVELTGADGQTAIGQVIAVGPTVDPASGTREVIVELAKPDGFRPGAAVAALPVPAKESEQL